MNGQIVEPIDSLIPNYEGQYINLYKTNYVNSGKRYIGFNIPNDGKIVQYFNIDFRQNGTMESYSIPYSPEDTSNAYGEYILELNSIDTGYSDYTLYHNSQQVDYGTVVIYDNNVNYITLYIYVE